MTKPYCSKRHGIPNGAAPAYSRNLVRTYWLKEASEYIRDNEFNIIIKGKDLVERVLCGELDLVRGSPILKE